MYKSLKYQNVEGTIICAKREDNSIVVLEPASGPEWTQAVTGAFGTIEPYTPPAEPTPEELLTIERQSMSCTPLQGILTLGETEWQKVLDYRETATWAEKIIIDSAQDWKRTSENIAFFGYLLGYDDEQMDTLFRQAKGVVA